MSEWERVDTPATVPSRGAAPATRRDAAPSLRLKRSRSPILTAFDAGGRRFQRRLRDVALGASLILVPAVALNLWVTIVAVDGFDPDSTSSFLFDDASTGTEDISVFVAIVFIGFTTAVVGHFGAVILIGDRFARPSTMSQSLLRTAKRLPAIFAAWALTHWWFIAMAALVVPADESSIPGLVFFFGLLAWFSSAATLLVIPVMVAEKLGPYRAAVRGFRLVRQRFGAALGFVALSTLLASLFGTGLTTMIPLLDQFGFLGVGDATTAVVGVMGQLAVVFVAPLVALATAQFYIEVRVAAEGLDLMIDADAAFGTASGTATGSTPGATT